MPTWELGVFAGGFLALGFGIGLTVYHFGLGFFISLTRKESLERAVEVAEGRLVRRVVRRHARERRRRGGEGVVGVAGRHLRR